jgi:hypothetical protein
MKMHYSGASHIHDLSATSFKMHSDGLKHVPKVPHAIEKAVHHE